MFRSLYSLLFLSDEDHCVRCTRNFVLSGNFHRSCSRRLYKRVQFNVPTMWRHLWFLWSMQAVHGWSRQLQKQLQETRPVLQDMAITWQQYAALMRANTIGSFQGRFCVLIPWIFRQFSFCITQQRELSKKLKSNTVNSAPSYLFYFLQLTKGHEKLWIKWF